MLARRQKNTHGSRYDATARSPLQQLVTDHAVARGARADENPIGQMVKRFGMRLRPGSRRPVKYSVRQVDHSMRSSRSRAKHLSPVRPLCARSISRDSCFAFRRCNGRGPRARGVRHHLGNDRHCVHRGYRFSWRRKQIHADQRRLQHLAYLTRTSDSTSCFPQTSLQFNQDRERVG